MDESGSRNILPMHEQEEPDPLDAEEGPDPTYARLTAQGLRELEDQRRAEEERRKASAPPPDTRTPEQKAAQLQEYAGGVFLFGADGSFFRMPGDPLPFKLYLDSFLKEAGASGDALERLLLEQVLLGHHGIGRLHFRAGSSQNLEVVTACLATVTRLMAECRRTTLALQTYRRDAAAGEARINKKPQHHAATAHVNGHGDDVAETPSHSEVGSKNRLNGYLNGACHAQPTHS